MNVIITALFIGALVGTLIDPVYGVMAVWVSALVLTMRKTW